MNSNDDNEAQPNQQGQPAPPEQQPESSSLSNEPEAQLPEPVAPPSKSVQKPDKKSATSAQAQQHTNSGDEQSFYQPVTPREQPGEPAPASNSKPEVEWQASEYIYHEKSPLWFGALAGITLVGVAAAVFFGQWTFAVLIAVMGAALGFFANRPPREIHYQIGSDGVTVGQRTFPFSQFRAFGVVNEGAFYSVWLRPTKRFMPGVSIIFAEADGEKIFDALAARLPAEEVHQDPIDKLQRRLRF